VTDPYAEPLTPQSWTKPCPACTEPVITYQPPGTGRAANPPKPVLFELTPSAAGRWVLTVYQGKLNAGKFNDSQARAAQEQGRELHEPHKNYCRYGERVPRR
jgi:hypothetical protein